MPFTKLGLSEPMLDRKSTRLNSSHLGISYAVFCLKKTQNAPGLVFSALHFPFLVFRSRYLQSHLLARRSDRRRMGQCRQSPGGLIMYIFFFNDPGTTEIYPLSLPAPLPI